MPSKLRCSSVRNSPKVSRFTTTLGISILKTGGPLCSKRKQRDRGILSTRFPPEETDRVRKGLLFASELWQMSDDEVRQLYDKARAEEAREEAVLREQAEFYSQPDSRFQLQHWARADCWSLEEGVALCLGKDPRVVNSETLKPHAGVQNLPSVFMMPWILRNGRVKRETSPADTTGSIPRMGRPVRARLSGGAETSR